MARRKISIIFLFIAFSVSFVCAFLCANKTYANGIDNKDYQVVFENSEFKGINLKTDDAGILSMRIKTVAEGFSATARDGALITIDLAGKEIDKSQTTGFAIKLKAENLDLYPRFLMETEDGYYRLWTGTATYYPWIKDDGTVSTISNGGASNCLTLLSSKGYGTYSFDWNNGQVIKLSGNGTSSVVKKIHLFLSMNNAQYAANAKLSIGALASYKIDGTSATVNMIFDAKDFVYASNATLTNCDVNPYDFTKGKTIRCDTAANSTTGDYQQNTNADDTAKVIANWKSFARTQCVITTKHLDKNGNQLSPSTTTNVSYNNNYNVAPQKLVIRGEFYG